MNLILNKKTFFNLSIFYTLLFVLLSNFSLISNTYADEKRDERRSEYIKYEKEKNDEKDYDDDKPQKDEETNKPKQKKEPTITPIPTPEIIIEENKQNTPTAKNPVQQSLAISFSSSLAALFLLSRKPDLFEKLLQKFPSLEELYGFFTKSQKVFKRIINKFRKKN